MNVSDWRAVLDGSKTTQRVERKPGHVWHSNEVSKLYKTSSLTLYYVGQVVGIQYSHRLPTARYRLVGKERVPVAYDVYRFLVAGLKTRGIPVDGHEVALVSLGYLPVLMTITEIKSDDVRHMEQQDAVDEGFGNPLMFWKWWCRNRDRSFHVPDDETAARELLLKRKANHYQAWVLKLNFPEG